MLKGCGWVTSFCILLLSGPVSELCAAERTPWTTSKVVGSPEPPDPYRLELAYPKLKLLEPLSAAVVPGSKRLMVAERPGKIWVLDGSA